MNDAQFIAWLKNPSADRVVLIEATALVGGVETTFYMSTKGGYRTSPTDSPANTSYDSCAEVKVLYTEEISLTTDDASLNAGVITVNNYDGKKDGWLNYVWINRPILALIGDMSWPKSEFRTIFNGVQADLVPDGRHTMSLKLRDKSQRLNAPLTEIKLGGNTQNKDNLIPLVFGECHNVTPLLVDPTNLIYKVHNGAIERIIEVRDNGVPVAATANLTNGTFTLQNQSFGTVTASVQGDKVGTTYTNKIASTIKHIVKTYGKDVDKFTDADIDTTKFDAFDAAFPQPIGAYFPDRTNVLEACRMLASSVGAQILMDRVGKLQIVQLAIPANGTPTVIDSNHMIVGTLAPVMKTDPVAAVKLGFNKNWTEQDDMLVNIPEEHKDLYGEEWLTTTVVDDTVKAKYRLTGEPVQQDTMLLTRADADVEASRRLNLWKVPRIVYEFEGTPEMLSLVLGQPVTVYNNRFGMSNGVTGTVISLAPDWSNGHVKVRFIV